MSTGFVVSLVLFLTLLPAAAVRAQIQTPDEQSCTRAMSRALAKLSTKLGDVGTACIGDFAEGSLRDSLEACAIGNPGLVASRLKPRPAKVFNRRCETTPAFGVTDAATVTFGAATSVQRVLRDTFGRDFDSAIAIEADDVVLSRCQQEVAEEIIECHAARTAGYRRCLRRGLPADIDSVEAMSDCVGAEPSRRVARTCDIPQDLAVACVDEGVSLATAFPGCGSADLATAASCLERTLDCQVCLALRTSAALASDCDLLDDGAANGSCMAVRCDLDPLMFIDMSGAPLELSDGGKLQLDCPIAPNPTPTDNLGPTYGMDHFAWNTFVAMNWPAISRAAVRGVPDLTRRFETAQSDDLTVWETFKEKREVFYRGSCTGDGERACSANSDCTPLDGSCDLSAPPGESQRSRASLLWTGPLQYGPQGAEVVDSPICSDHPGGELPDRLVTSSTKLHFDSLDETVEVQSEALESVDQLCGGYLLDPSVECQLPSPNPCCGIGGQAVGPRIWKGDPSQGGRPILYEVKVNYDYFDYVTDASNMYYIDTLAGQAADGAAFLLPWRSNALMGGSGANAASILGYNAHDCLLSFGHDGKMPAPCRIGSVHAKAAWLLLEDEDPSLYHTAEASYFKQDPIDPLKVCKTSGTFGLLGLHIIQRTHHVSPPATPPTTPGFTPIGGAYIFATWEHTGNDTAGLRYANYHFPTKAFYPATTDTLPLTRMFDLLDATKAVNSEVHASLGCPESGSVWCNYRLIGTQFAGVDADDSTITNGEQPFYLANLVLESNIGLQMFEGLPPNVTPIAQFASVPANPTDDYVHDAANTLYNQTAKNMGGCMGCHGVAQLNGFTFSFVSQDGQRGAGVDTETPGQFGPAPSP